jgi:pilus assembly protein Flp/PilA
MRKLLTRFARDESGATAIEYGLIVAVISLAMIAGFSQFAEALHAMFEYIGGLFQQALSE